MNLILKTILSMSFSGALLILALLVVKRFLKYKTSRQWQYYIWLIVIIRLFLPFSPEESFMGKIYSSIEWTTAHPTTPVQQPSSIDNVSAPVELDQNNKTIPIPADVTDEKRPLQDLQTILLHQSWLLWLAGALGILIHKVTIYQSFVRYIQAGSIPVSNLKQLDRLSAAAELAGVRRPMELCINPLVSSPLLIGFFHPCIILPSDAISEEDFFYIALHECIHYKRRDMFYKWLVQITVCLHWFNPLVYLMRREITKACEFSCDEAVLAKIGQTHAQNYGKTLLNAMASVGNYRESLGAVTLNQNKKLLKERLGAIMSFQKQSILLKTFTGLLTVSFFLTAFFLGIYPTAATMVSANESQPAAESKPDHKEEKKISATRAEQYYEADSLPLFQIAFSRMDADTQSAWLDKIYEDEAIAFFSVSIDQLNGDNALLSHFAEKVYADGAHSFFSILLDHMSKEMLEDWLDRTHFAEKLYADGAYSFFSILADHMSKEMLEDWLDRALDDRNFGFQSLIFQKLDWNFDWADELEEKHKQSEEQKTQLETQKLEEYQLYGITREGKLYYYNGQLINIFLDIRQDSSFYTLDFNPEGTINIKISRNKEGKIISVEVMTEAEIEELFGDMDDTDDN